MAVSSGLETGATAPAFSLSDADSNIRSLDDFAGRHIVLFFFPRADTPGCTAEAQDFSARLRQFESIDTVVIGISADPPRKLARFRGKREITAILLSDEAHDALDAYGVWGKKAMYGKTFEGILRTTFLVGPDRKIAQIWRGVKVPGHAEAVLQAARKLA